MANYSLADKYTSISKKSEIYSDFTSSFFAHPESEQLIRVTNEDSVKQSIKNIILTDKYERFYNSNLAGNIRSLLFENFVPEVISQIQTLIENAIKNYEPRAKQLSVEVDASPDQNSLNATIVFYIINKVDPIQLQITLYRVR